jgi:hypothetical protein
MGLFSKKKVEERQELPPLKFPEFSKEEHSNENIPSDQGVIKRTIVPPPNLMIPIRKPVQPKSDDMMMQEERPPRPVERERPRPSEFTPSRKERTLFVKVDRYKDVMSKMDMIRDKIAESEKVLQRLQHIRSQEEHELKVWQDDLNRVKETLIAVDRALFE